MKHNTTKRLADFFSDFSLLNSFALNDVINAMILH